MTPGLQGTSSTDVALTGEKIRAVIGVVEMLRVDAAGGWQSVPRRSSHSCGASRNQTPWAIHFRGGGCFK